MTDTIIVSLIAFAGPLFGTFGGIITSAKLSNYRIEQLEKKVDKHNSFAEEIPVMKNRISVCEHRIDDLEHNH